MPREAIERLDANVQRVLRERYDNVIPLVAAPKNPQRTRIARRRAVVPGAFRVPAPDCPAA